MGGTHAGASGRAQDQASHRLGRRRAGRSRSQRPGRSAGRADRSVAHREGRARNDRRPAAGRVQRRPSRRPSSCTPRRCSRSPAACRLPGLPMPSSQLGGGDPSGATSRSVDCHAFERALYATIVPIACQPRPALAVASQSQFAASTPFFTIATNPRRDFCRSIFEARLELKLPV